MPAGVNLLTLQEVRDAVGEDGLGELLSSFSCPRNEEVERFLRDARRARQSSGMGMSVTYLAMDSGSGDLLGYFTLMMKAYSVRVEDLNSANRRLVKRYSGVDAAGNASAPVYLIAQIGKNFSVPEARRIGGSALLDLAMSVLAKAKRLVGGKLVMVEREADRPKLLAFYERNGFRSWTARRNARDGVVYDQMFLALGDE